VGNNSPGICCLECLPSYARRTAAMRLPPYRPLDPWHRRGNEFLPPAPDFLLSPGSKVAHSFIFLAETPSHGCPNLPVPAPLGPLEYSTFGARTGLGMLTEDSVRGPLPRHLSADEKMAARAENFVFCRATPRNIFFKSSLRGQFCAVPVLALSPQANLPARPFVRGAASTNHIFPRANRGAAPLKFNRLSIRTVLLCYMHAPNAKREVGIDLRKAAAWIFCPGRKKLRNVFFSPTSKRITRIARADTPPTEGISFFFSFCFCLDPEKEALPLKARRVTGPAYSPGTCFECHLFTPQPKPPTNRLI